jgi:uncharacterized membrane protein (DUF373 family)
LSWVDTGERLVARILALITGVVIISALLKLVLSLGSKLLTGSEATWLGDDLIKVLGDLLTVLIALEVLQNITSYLRRHVVQIELVLVTALTAVARKVIVLPSGAEDKPQLLVGLGSLSQHWRPRIGWLSVPIQRQPKRSRIRIASFNPMETMRRNEEMVAWA